MYKDATGSEVNPEGELLALTNKALLKVSYRRKELTVLENELLHRLETYVVNYGDYMGDA